MRAGGRDDKRQAAVSAAFITLPSFAVRLPRARATIAPHGPYARRAVRGGA
jgi:hypothetical protein